MTSGDWWVFRCHFSDVFGRCIAVTFVSGTVLRRVFQFISMSGVIRLDISPADMTCYDDISNCVTTSHSRSRRRHPRVSCVQRRLTSGDALDELLHRYHYILDLRVTIL